MIVVDTSALICLMRNEIEAARFMAALLGESDARMSSANYLEAGIVADATGQPRFGARLDPLIEHLGIVIVDVTPAHARLARQAYRTYGKGYHAAKLNFGDCFAYALAKAENAPLLFKGDDFAKTDIVSAA